MRASGGGVALAGCRALLFGTRSQGTGQPIFIGRTRQNLAVINDARRVLYDLFAVHVLALTT